MPSSIASIGHNFEAFRAAINITGLWISTLSPEKLYFMIDDIEELIARYYRLMLIISFLIGLLLGAALALNYANQQLLEILEKASATLMKQAITRL